MSTDIRVVVVQVDEDEQVTDKYLFSVTDIETRNPIDVIDQLGEVVKQSVRNIYKGSGR